MSDNVKYGKDLSGNGYDGTYVDVETVDAPGQVNSSTRRGVFNGTSSRFFLSIDSDNESVAIKDYLFMCVFKRSSTDVGRTDDQIAERLWSTYATDEGVRVAVGIDADKLALLYSDGSTFFPILVRGNQLISDAGDHHLMVRVDGTTGGTESLQVLLDGKVEIEVFPSGTIVQPGLTNPCVGGDGNRRLFHGEIDFPALLAPHFLYTEENRGFISYFPIVGRDLPVEYTVWTRFDEAASDPGVTLDYSGYVAQAGSAPYIGAIVEDPFLAGGSSSVEFVIPTITSSIRIGLATPAFDTSLDVPLGVQPNTLGMATDGTISLVDGGGTIYDYTVSGKFISEGDVVRFDYDSVTSEVTIYINDELVNSITTIGMTWYAAASLRTDIVGINTGVRHYRSELVKNPIPHHTYTGAESAVILAKTMPKSEFDVARQATLLFLDSLASTDLTDEVTGDVIGEYSVTVDRLQASLTPNPEDRSVALNGGTVKMDDVNLTSQGLNMSAHLAFILEYEDLFEDKVLFEMDKGADWWRFYIRAGELCIEYSTSGGSPEHITTGYIFPVQETCTAALTLVDGQCKFVTGGVEFVEFAIPNPPSPTVAGELFIGSNPLGNNALTQFFSHAMWLGCPGTADFAPYQVWKYRKIAVEAGASGLVEEATYEFPLETITQRLYDFMTITLPGYVGWSP